MNEEAGFIAALIAEPDDRTAMLVYADWLDDRSDPRAEYLRLLARTRPNQKRLGQLRRTLDCDWIHLIDTRHLRVGCCVRILEGSFAAQEGELTAITPDRRNVTVRLTFWGRPLDVEIPLAILELATATPEAP